MSLWAGESKAPVGSRWLSWVYMWQWLVLCVQSPRSLNSLEFDKVMYFQDIKATSENQFLVYHFIFSHIHFYANEFHSFGFSSTIKSFRRQNLV